MQPLEDILSARSVRDVVADGDVHDRILHAGGDLVVWFRMLRTQGSEGLIELPPGKRGAAVYVFRGRRWIATIPVDVPDHPFAPATCDLGKNELLLLSYVFSPKEFHYKVQVHSIANGSCASVFEKEFQALSYSRNHHPIVRRFVFFKDPQGVYRLIALDHEMGPPEAHQERMDVRCLESYLWDPERRSFHTPFEEPGKSGKMPQ